LTWLTKPHISAILGGVFVFHLFRMVSPTWRFLTILEPLHQVQELTYSPPFPSSLRQVLVLIKREKVPYKELFKKREVVEKRENMFLFRKII